MIRRCQASPALGVARFSELLPLPDGTCDRGTQAGLPGASKNGQSVARSLPAVLPLGLRASHDAEPHDELVSNGTSALQSSGKRMRSSLPYSAKK